MLLYIEARVLFMLFGFALAVGFASTALAFTGEMSQRDIDLDAYIKACGSQATNIGHVSDVGNEFIYLSATIIASTILVFVLLRYIRIGWARVILKLFLTIILALGLADIVFWFYARPPISLPSSTHNHLISWCKAVDLTEQCQVKLLIKGHQVDGLELINGQWMDVTGAPSHDEMWAVARAAGIQCGFVIGAGME